MTIYNIRLRLNFGLIPRLTFISFVFQIRTQLLLLRFYIALGFLFLLNMALDRFVKQDLVLLL